MENSSEWLNDHRSRIVPEHYSLLSIIEKLLLQTKLPAFASSVIRRHKPSRSSSGVELQEKTGHHHNGTVHGSKFTMYSVPWQVELAFSIGVNCGNAGRVWPDRMEGWDGLSGGLPWARNQPIGVRSIIKEWRGYFSPFSISFKMLYSSSSKIVLTDSRSVAVPGTSFIFGSSRSAWRMSSISQASFISCLLAATT